MRVKLLLVGALGALFSIGHAPSFSFAPAANAASFSSKPPSGQFHLHNGFVIEAVATNGLVDSPVAAAWDLQGRLWVVEQPPSSVQGDAIPAGRLVRLEDSDGNGTLDRRTVLAQRFHAASGIVAVDEGVLVADAPHLWLCRATNSQQSTLAMTDLAETIPAADRTNAIGRGIFWALDNWIYSGGGTYRFKPAGTRWMSERTYSRGQTGLTQDNFGRFYYCFNSDPLRVDLVPPGALERNRHYPKFSGANVAITKNRFAPPQLVGSRADPLPDLVSPTSTLLYRGGSLGQKVDNTAFVCDPTLHLVRCLRLHRSSFSGDARQSILTEIANEDGDFLRSDDPQFRPLQLSPGPDGGLYIVDSGTAGAKPLNAAPSSPAGHIYRVAYKKVVAGPNPRPTRTADWVKLLSHPNPWWRDTAQHHFTQTRDASTAAPLRETVANNPNASARLHALLALQGMEILDRSTWSFAAKDLDPAVSVAAARLSDQFLSTTNRELVLNDFMRVIKSSDVSSDLQLEILLALGASPRRDAVPVLSELVARGIHSDFHLHALLSAVPGLELEVLQKLIADPRCGATASHERVMRALSSAVAVEAAPQRIARAIEMSAQQSYNNSRTTLAVLNGVLGGLDDSTKQDPVARAQRLSMVREEAWIVLNRCSNHDVRDRALQLRSGVH